MTTRIQCHECLNTEVVEDGDSPQRVMARHICTDPADDTCRSCAVGVRHDICANRRIA